MSRTSYLKWKDGKPLSRKQAMDAQCYECNGYSVEKKDDCQATLCPLYQWSTWGKSHGLRPVSMRGKHLQRKK